jgi:hypothetical protein
MRTQPPIENFTVNGYKVATTRFSYAFTAMKVMVKYGEGGERN